MPPGFPEPVIERGEVGHVFTAGGGDRYVLPFCRVSGGTCTVAF